MRKHCLTFQLFILTWSSLLINRTLQTNETNVTTIPSIISRGILFQNSTLLSSSLEAISQNHSNSSVTTSTLLKAIGNNTARYSFITVGKPVDTSAFLSADDQCKLLHGKQATFCRSHVYSICQTLSCRLSLNDSCVDGSVGARDGTICAQGKICMQGVCTESERAPYGDCLFGDDLVFQEAIGMTLPSAQMTCDAVLKYVDSLNQSPTAYCSNSNFRQICCQTCKKYDRLECTDKYFDCPRYRKVCKTSSINGVSLNILCPRTCGRCAAKPLQCSSEKELCQNGGTCVNLTVPEENLFGFRCHCAIGYYGDLCEKKNSCLPNPCRMDETCDSYGTIAYKCTKIVVSSKQDGAAPSSMGSQPPQSLFTTPIMASLSSTMMTTIQAGSPFIQSNNNNKPPIPQRPSPATPIKSITMFNNYSTSNPMNKRPNGILSTRKNGLTSSLQPTFRPQTPTFVTNFTWSTTTTSKRTPTTTSTTTTITTTSTTTTKLTTTIRTSHKSTVGQTPLPTSQASPPSQATVSANVSSVSNNTGNVSDSDTPKPILKIMQLNPMLQNVFNCVNFNDEVCNYYSSKNLCDPYYYLNGESIAIKCPKACKKC